MPQRKTTQQFKEEVYDLVGDEYLVLGEYKNATTKVGIKHNTCNYKYEVTPHNFLFGNRRCPNCFGTKKKTTKQFKDEVYNLVNDEYSVLGNYSGANKKILIKHNICNYKYEVTPHNFLCGKKCPKCAGNQKRTTEDFITFLEKVRPNEYLVLGNYVNSQTPIKVKHLKCNQVYYVRPNDLTRKDHGQTECKYCHALKGEKRILSFLKKYKIEYSMHKHFNWLNYEGAQHLDFYLPTYNLAIEYDGVQHFSPQRFGGISIEKAKQNYIKQVEKDKNKNRLCKKYGIKLIRIPYYEFDSINKILTKELRRS